MSGLDWTEELKKRTGIDFLTTRPMEIEKKSFEIIKGELGDEFVSSYPADALPLLCRVIHTTADFFLQGHPDDHRRSCRKGKGSDPTRTSDHHGHYDGCIRDQ